MMAFSSIRTLISFVFTEAMLVVLSIVWKIKIVFSVRGEVLFAGHVALHGVEKSNLDRENNCITRTQQIILKRISPASEPICQRILLLSMILLRALKHIEIHIASQLRHACS